MSAADGCVLPVPGVMTFDARPEAVFAASAGGAATSGGGVAADTFGACANSGDARSSESTANEKIRMSQKSFRPSILTVLPCRPHVTPSPSFTKLTPNLVVDDVDR